MENWKPNDTTSSSWGDFKKLWTENDFTSTDKGNWDTAYGWGDHSTEGYLTAHPNISAASSVNNSNRTYIQDITVDSNGHVTGITSATETVTDTNTQLSNEQVQDIVGAMVSGNTETNISVTYDDTNGKLNFASTDTNTQLTDAQVRSKISGTGLISYNSSTGVISTTANNYSHPTFNGDDFSIDTGALTGATVISDLDINITTNSEGHVTDANGTVATRTLTLANLGYTGANDADNYADWKFVDNADSATNIRSANYVKFDGANIRRLWYTSRPLCCKYTRHQHTVKYRTSSRYCWGYV